MTKQSSLGRKILTAMIVLVVVTLIAEGLVFALTMRNVTDTLSEGNRSLTGTIKDSSSAYLSAESEVLLARMAGEKADIADLVFADFKRGVTTVASVAEDIYGSPENYAPRAVALPDPDCDGELTVQALFSASADPDDPETARELGLIGNVSDVLTAVNEGQDSIASVYVATESGIMVQADYISARKFDESGALMPLEAKDRPWYRGAAETGEPYFTPVTRDLHTPRLAIMCGVPVYAGGRLMGVAGGGMYLDELEDLVQSVDLGEGGNACIVNGSGQVLFSTFAEGTLAAAENAEDLRRSADADLAETAGKAAEGGTGVVRLTVDSVPYYVAYAPMKTVGWSMLVFLPQETVDAPTERLIAEVDRTTEESFRDADDQIRHAVYLLLGLFAAGVAVAVGVSVALSGHIVKPIRRLTEKVRTMEGDSLDFTWDMDTRDETQTLATSFQSLTQRMKDYISDIETITAENERINTELTLAAQIQTNMLPSVFPPFPERRDVDIFASMDAAKEVGGDFYDFFLIDEDHLCLAVADVSGKGVPAALFMMACKIIIGNYFMLGQTPGQVLETANQAICASSKDGMFITVWAGILDLKTGLLTAANAGHEYPVLRQPDGRFELVRDKHGLVVGGMPGMRYKEYTLQLQPGSKLFLYTDGVPEATDAQNRMFGTDRMLEALNTDPGAAPRQLLKNVRNAVDAFVGGAEQFDDLTMLYIEYRGPENGGQEPPPEIRG